MNNEISKTFTARATRFTDYMSYCCMQLKLVEKFSLLLTTNIPLKMNYKSYFKARKLIIDLNCKDHQSNKLIKFDCNRIRNTKVI